MDSLDVKAIKVENSEDDSVSTEGEDANSESSVSCGERTTPGSEVDSVNQFSEEIEEYCQIGEETVNFRTVDGQPPYPLSLIQVGNGDEEDVTSLTCQSGSTQEGDSREIVSLKSQTSACDDLKETFAKHKYEGSPSHTSPLPVESETSLSFEPLDGSLGQSNKNTPSGAKKRKNSRIRRNRRNVIPQMVTDTLSPSAESFNKTDVNVKQEENGETSDEEYDKSTPAESNFDTGEDISTLESKSDLKKGKVYRCEICMKMFSRPSRLVTHCRKHTGERPFICEICGKGFTEQSTLNSHSRIHSDHKPYECQLCMKTFSYKSNLISHMKTHTGEKSYSCEMCAKTFAQHSDLRRHLRIHSGSQPYQCEECPRSFSQQSSLVRHSRVHTGDRPYKCDVCEKCFAQQSTLVGHVRSHTGEKPYQCEICEKTFALKCNLICHRKVHSGERPFQCDVCLKTFGHQWNLTCHMKIHSGEKPYKCKVCSKSFVHQTQLLRHDKVHMYSSNDVSLEILAVAADLQSGMEER